MGKEAKKSDRVLTAVGFFRHKHWHAPSKMALFCADSAAVCGIAAFSCDAGVSGGYNPFGGAALVGLDPGLAQAGTPLPYCSARAFLIFLTSAASGSFL